MWLLLPASDELAERHVWSVEESQNHRGRMELRSASSGDDQLQDENWCAARPDPSDGDAWGVLLCIQNRATIPRPPSPGREEGCGKKERRG